DKRTPGDGFRAVRFQVGERPANRRAGADAVVHDGHPPTAHGLASRRRKSVLNRIEAVSLGMRQSFGVGKAQVQLLGHHLRDERSPDQRAADHLGLVRGEVVGELFYEWTDIDRPDKQLVEIEPELTVMTRLELEMAFATY